MALNRLSAVFNMPEKMFFFLILKFYLYPARHPIAGNLFGTVVAYLYKSLFLQEISYLVELNQLKLPFFGSR